MRDLAEGGYIERAEPVLLIGDCGTGKTHLSDRPLRGRVPAEAARPFHHGGRAGQRAGGSQTSTPTAAGDGALERYDLIAIDEVGYVPLAEVGAEFLFQVIAERAERAAVICDHEPAVLRVDAGDSQCPALQSAAGSDHRSRSHSGDRHGAIASGERWKQERKRRLRNHWAGEGAQPPFPGTPSRLSTGIG